MNQLIQVFLILGCGLLTSCCYQFGHGELSQSYRTISIPYAEEDQKGELTTEVVKKLSCSGAFCYVNCDGDLNLNIKFLEIGEENIDFRYDRKKDGELKKSTIPTETRIKATVEITLVDNQTGKIVRGPTRISASTDFDHTYYTTWHAVNIYSLGQLNDIYEARDAVMHPLNRCLAEKIVDYIINS